MLPVHKLELPQALLYCQDYCTFPFYLAVHFGCIDASGFYANYLGENGHAHIGQ